MKSLISQVIPEEPQDFEDFVDDDGRPQRSSRVLASLLTEFECQAGCLRLGFSEALVGGPPPRRDRSDDRGRTPANVMVSGTGSYDQIISQPWRLILNPAVGRMHHDEAAELYRAIQDSKGSSARSPDLSAWLEAAVSYANLRSKWGLLSVAEQAERDLQRTSLHNVAIDAINRLSRETHSRGESNEWRAKLGDDRKRIGDFACWCALFIGLNRLESRQPF